MQILTKTGYKDAADCQVGDEVLAWVNGEQVYNTILSIEQHKAQDYSLKEPILDENGAPTGEYGDEQNDLHWYKINGTLFFSMQQVWVNDGIRHANELKLGDTIYDDQDNPIEITSIEQLDLPDEIWYRFLIDGEHSYIGDNVTLHNSSLYWNPAADSAWNAVGNIWATTDGGSVYGSTPTSGDDANFSSTNAHKCTASSGNVCATLDFYTLNFAGEWAGSSDITISGNLAMKSGMTRSYTGAITMNKSSGTATIRSDTITFAGFFTFNHTGTTFQLIDSLTTNGTQPTLTAGTFDATTNSATVTFTNSSTTIVATVLWTFYNLSYIPTTPTINDYLIITGTYSGIIISNIFKIDEGATVTNRCLLQTGALGTQKTITCIRQQWHLQR